jgi:hypothetical protein
MVCSPLVFLNGWCCVVLTVAELPLRGDHSIKPALDIQRSGIHLGCGISSAQPSATGNTGQDYKESG